MLGNMTDTVAPDSLLNIRLENGKTVEEELRSFQTFAALLDSKFEVFGLKFGADSLIGLIPVAGDVSTGVAGIYALGKAQQLKLPLSASLHILWNLGFDTAIGAIPVVGDIFDFFFRSHAKNFKIVEKHLKRKAEKHGRVTGQV